MIYPVAMVTRYVGQIRCIALNDLSFKVAVNCELQKLIHGLFNFVVRIKLCMHSFSVLYCRASLTLLPQQIS